MAAVSLRNSTLFTDANLQAYWELENVNDSKNSYTLTNGNTVTFVAGKFNNGANIAGSNKSLKILDNIGVTFSTAYTMCGWIKLNNEISSGDWALFDINHNANGSEITLLKYQYNGGSRQLYFTRYNSGAVGDYGTYSVALGTSSYHFFAIQYTGTAMKLFLDGSEVFSTNSASTAGTTGPYTKGVGLGMEVQNTTGNTDAIFDDVAIFNRALSSTEISNHYSGADALKTGGSLFYSQI
jgi:hypothetical protein